MAAQKATDIRRAIVDVEVNAKLLREHQAAVEHLRKSASVPSARVND
jgi:hypothetical protein